jgi:hypothetical protein
MKHGILCATNTNIFYKKLNKRCRGFLIKHVKGILTLANKKSISFELTPKGYFPAKEEN